MQTFKIVFQEDGRGVARTMEFEGQTAAAALSLLEREKDARQAELWTTDNKLADLVRDRSGVWLLNFDS